jgi:hypothetical protein
VNLNKLQPLKSTASDSLSLQSILAHYQSHSIFTSLHNLLNLLLLHMLASTVFHITIVHLVLCLLSSSSTMPDFNPDISNGTCYYKDSGRLPSRYIPCGNGALGHKTCCESLDMCLSSRACYNGQYGVTYLAGCTDPDYQDATCPDKNPFQGTTTVHQPLAQG